MPQFEHDEEVATETREKLTRPPLFKVLLHNDDFTTQDFVVWILMIVFQKAEPEARTIMLNVHQEGLGVAGVFTYEIAEMKVAQVMALSQANEYPLLCTMERE